MRPLLWQNDHFMLLSPPPPPAEKEHRSILLPVLIGNRSSAVNGVSFSATLAFHIHRCQANVPTASPKRVCGNNGDQRNGSAGSAEAHNVRPCTAFFSGCGLATWARHGNRLLHAAAKPNMQESWEHPQESRMNLHRATKSPS